MTTPDYAGLIERLSSPVSMSMFAHQTDMVRALLKDREEATEAIRTLLESKATLERERDAWKSECEYHERQRFSTALSLVKGGVDG